MKPLAAGGTPNSMVTSEWGPVEVTGSRDHMAIVLDQWRTSCRCAGCPDCAPVLVLAASTVGYVWRAAATWGEATCDGCDVLVCEQPRHGLWVAEGKPSVCGHCLSDILEKQV